jgi:hypothetical protein
MKLHNQELQNLYSSPIWFSQIMKSKKKETGWNGVDWIRLAEDRDQWQALVDMVIYL